MSSGESAFGVKRTSQTGAAMSAYDPQRRFAYPELGLPLVIEGPIVFACSSRGGAKPIY